VLAAEACALRYSSVDGDRVLLLNLGPDLSLGSIPEPLVAPPDDHRWIVEWSSEEPAYGGGGTPMVVDESGWRIPGHAAIVLRPMPDIRPDHGE
jgi:maltooligosyltrehalose trehalohydrolase